MKYLTIFILLIQINVFLQERGAIFNTGAPEDIQNGFVISNSQSIANRFIVQNDYVLEAMTFYMTTTSSDSDIIISIRDDNSGAPGELVSDLSTWDYTVDPLNSSGYNVLVTTDLCIYLDEGDTYWWQINAADELTETKWAYSASQFYTYASSPDQTNWEFSVGPAGAGAIYAEQIYQPPFSDGDVNFDFTVNVIDIVAIVSHIMELNLLINESLEYGDVNSDGFINVVDIVQLVNNILQEQHQNPDFISEDINPSSEYFGQNIGPSFFEDQVSCYYFGKQG